MEPSETLSAITWLDTVPSTNQCIRERISGLDNLSVIAAAEQTAGRGQGAHTWFSSPGTNLTFSMLLRPRGLMARDSVLLSCTAALGVRDYLGSRSIAAGIKLPNDIWVGKKKICGLLIENILEGKLVRESIVGIGLNVNQLSWPEDLPNPVSMRELTGTTYDLGQELEVLCGHLARRAAMLGSAEGRDLLIQEFNNNIFIP